MEIRYLPIMKSNFKKLRLNFNEHVKIKGASRKLNALPRVSSVLSYQHNKVVFFHQWTIQLLSSYLDIWFY